MSRVRSIPGQQIRSLIENHIEKPLAGLFGVERINVLKLNMDLDHLK
ncbi:MAG TPA: potassium-transporting ATPase subunit C [Flavisolibacter sp.]|nr:potassium-transporting ATPase subunit C [Flavisolibacter sp.]